MRYAEDRFASLVVAERVALRVARAFRRKCWWACLDDLTQVARIATWRSMRTYKTGHRVPFAMYADRAATFAVWKYVLRQSAPVSASDHYVSNLKGLTRAGLSAIEGKEARRTPEQLLADRNWRARVRERVRELLLGTMEQSDADIACAVMFDEAKPADIARDNSLQVTQVYKVRRRAGSLVLRDKQCYGLLQEISK